MKRMVLKSKIHRIKVTATNIDYEGSLSLDPEIMEKADLREYERVEVYNITNGERFTTYVIKGNKGEVCLNGASARKGVVGDLLIIASYTWLDDEELSGYNPKIISFDS